MRAASVKSTEHLVVVSEPLRHCHMWSAEYCPRWAIMGCPLLPSKIDLDFNQLKYMTIPARLMKRGDARV